LSVGVSTKLTPCKEAALMLYIILGGRRQGFDILVKTTFGIPAT